MTSTDRTRVLTIVVCGAGPASSVLTLTAHAIERGWIVQVVATPAALAFIDVNALEKQTGSPVRSQYSPPGTPRSKVPHVIIVAPATYNTICKWAFGTSDTYALGILAEMTGMDIPVIVLPYVNAALASRTPFQNSVKSLRAEGVRILLGPDGVEPHQPRSGADPSRFPWHLALDEADRLLLRASPLASGRPLLRPLAPRPRPSGFEPFHLGRGSDLSKGACRIGGTIDIREGCL